jgi:hypothetical protein
MIPRYLTPVADWHALIPFNYFLINLIRPTRVVELGVCAGDSLYSSCQILAVLKRADTSYLPSVFGIDTWEGDENCKYDPDLYYNSISDATSQMREWVALIKSTSVAAVSEFADCSIDLLHIDADHSYDAVKLDFETYLPKMTTTGCIIFHDIDPNIISAATGKKVDGASNVWHNLILPEYPNKTLSLYHSCGLGVLFPNAFPNKETEDFITNEDHDSIRTYFGLLGQHTNFYGKVSL